MTSETSDGVPDKYDFRYGKHCVIVYQAYDENDAAVDLSGGTASLVFYEQDSTTVVLTVTTTANGNGSVITLGPNGELAATIQGADATVLYGTVGKNLQGRPAGVFELQVTIGGVSDCYAYGTYEVYRA